MKKKLKECISKEKVITTDFCKVHFGDKQRINLLKKVISGDKIPTHVQSYLGSLDKKDAEPIVPSEKDEKKSESKTDEIKPQENKKEETIPQKESTTQ